MSRGPTTSGGFSMEPGWKAMLTSVGVSPADVLRLAGLPEDLFAQEAIRLEPAAYFRFCQAIDDLVADPELPLRMAESLDAASFSPPIFAGLCSPDLKTAAERIARFKSLVAPIRLVVDVGRTFCIGFHWLDPNLQVAPLYQHFEILFFTQLARMGTRERVEPLSVQTPSIPTPKAAYEDFLGCSIRPGPHLEVEFRKEDADRPFLTSNPSMWSAFEPHLQSRLSQLEGASTYAERTRAILLEALPAGITDVHGVAGRLAVSSRTLQRRLREEDVTFKDIVRNVREELARHYLGRTHLTSSEIAYLLGFDQPSSFFRAFHSWTGTTPETVRRQTH